MYNFTVFMHNFESVRDEVIATEHNRFQNSSIPGFSAAQWKAVEVICGSVAIACAAKANEMHRKYVDREQESK